MNENRNVPILHNMTILNYAVSVLPITANIVVYIVFFSFNHHFDNENYFFPCTSDIIIFQPEYRIHSVFMTMGSILILFVFYIQDKVRVILGKRLHKINTQKFKIIRVISYVSCIIYLIGHQILAVVPYKTSKTLVSIGNNFNGIGLIGTFISCDIFNAYLNHASSIVSRITTWVVFITTIFNLLIRYYIFTNDQSDNIQWWTMSTVFFAIEQWCGYSKFTLMSQALPPAAIRLSRNIV